MHTFEPQLPDLSLATIEDCMDMYEKKEHDGCVQ